MCLTVDNAGIRSRRAEGGPDEQHSRAASGSYDAEDLPTRRELDRVRRPAGPNEVAFSDGQGVLEVWGEVELG
jgi:hypothetical protein